MMAASAVANSPGPQLDPSYTTHLRCKLGGDFIVLPHRCPVELFEIYGGHGSSSGSLAAPGILFPVSDRRHWARVFETTRTSAVPQEATVEEASTTYSLRQVTPSAAACDAQRGDRSSTRLSHSEKDKKNVNSSLTSLRPSGATRQLGPYPTVKVQSERSFKASQGSADEARGLVVTLSSRGY